MKLNFNNLAAYIEIQKDCADLKEYGLSDEEISGYVDFFAQNWTDIKNINYEN